jgi:hypothetical protein
LGYTSTSRRLLTIVFFNRLVVTLIVITQLITTQVLNAVDVSEKTPKTIETVIGYVNKYCAACHKVPPPNLMPRKDWAPAIDVMVDMANKEVGGDFIPEDIVKDIKAYYRGSSPEQLPRLPHHKDTEHSNKFIAKEIATKAKTPNIININSVFLSDRNSAEFLICDGDKNQIILLSNTKGTWNERVLADIKAPSHTQVIDYDNDGDNDIIVAALGFLPPSEALAGKVFLLRQSTTGEFSKELILEGVGRITDAQALDVDNDNDLDILVAIFGGGKVGELIWLENVGKPGLIKRSLIKVSGALNISPVDLNNDGLIDIVSLIAQEHEMVVALINQGKGEFKAVSLIEAPHPMFGFTGLKLVDLDQDDDVDILFTNGDSHDLQMDPKPYHGIQWLENQGNLNFQFHDIARFYGAVTAVAGDMDSDGDLDIVASSWNNYWDDDKRQSLIWFENNGKQKFTRHNINNSPQSIVTLALKDVSGNGGLDIIAGVLRMDLLIKNMFAPPTTKSDIDKTLQSPVETRVILMENNILQSNKTKKASLK